MNRYFFLTFLLLIPATAQAQKYRAADGKLRVALVVNPYGGDRAGPETDTERMVTITRPRPPSAVCLAACPWPSRQATP